MRASRYIGELFRLHQYSCKRLVKNIVRKVKLRADYTVSHSFRVVVRAEKA